MKAQRCCCHDYQGELFEFYVSIDEPWMVKLSNVRTQDYKEWRKTVEQEVKYMIRDKERSKLVEDNLLGNITFIEFHKTPGKKLNIQRLLNRLIYINRYCISNFFYILK